MARRLPPCEERDGPKVTRRRIRLAFETLEPRHLLSAAGVAAPAWIVLHPAAVSNAGPVGLTPAEVRGAYGFDQIALADARGAPVPASGAGQTIAIVDAYNDPNIAGEVAAFSRQFGLPQFNVPGGPTLKVTSQSGSTTALPPTDADWSVEIALDVEWAHAIAPGASILLVEANSDGFPDLLLAVNRAKVQTGVSVISMSWGGSEFPGETTWDSAFLPRRTNPGQTFVAASGDEGSPPEWPAISPNVLSVGGTTLNLAGSAYAGETAWSGSTGGVAAFESEPLYQSRVQSTGRRANPDVAFNADPDTGVAVYTVNGGSSTWLEIGGTSAGAPQWAGLLAVANQGRTLKGLPPLNAAQAALYNLPATDFHDITDGSNGGFSAGRGYDGVTGLGSPRANLMVQHLVGGVPAGSAAPVSGNTGIVLPAFSILGGGRLSPAVVVAASGSSGTGGASDQSSALESISPNHREETRAGNPQTDASDRAAIRIGLATTTTNGGAADLARLAIKSRSTKAKHQTSEEPSDWTLQIDLPTH